MQDELLLSALTRIADALERISPPPPLAPDWRETQAFFWHAGKGFSPVEKVNALPLELLMGIDSQKYILLDNITRFAHGLAANNALLWGARGTGKSSLVKSIFRHLSPTEHSLILLEIAREEIASLPALLSRLKGEPKRFLLLCDDLSFDAGDAAYKSLKSVLDGGIEERPDNVLFCATSNRRHLMPRDMVENEKNSAIHPNEAIDEKVSLSDRFGLWIGFHNMDQPTYLAIIEAYINHFGIEAQEGIADWRAEAIEWQMTRGARSGRVAWQFFCDYAGRMGKQVKV